jgi:hypothetical protein
MCSYAGIGETPVNPKRSCSTKLGLKRSSRKPLKLIGGGR